MSKNRYYVLCAALVMGGLLGPGYAQPGPQAERQRRGNGERMERREQVERGERGERGARLERRAPAERGAREERVAPRERGARMERREETGLEELRATHREAQRRVWELMQDEKSTEEELLAAVRRAGRLNVRVQEERVRQFVARRERGELPRDRAEGMRERRQRLQCSACGASPMRPVDRPERPADAPRRERPDRGQAR